MEWVTGRIQVGSGRELVEGDNMVTRWKIGYWYGYRLGCGGGFCGKG